MQSAKQSPRAAEKARKLAEYEAWYVEQIQMGIEDADAGRVISHEQMISESNKRLAALTKKHGNKTA
jgi:predicted transcriptional regulator